MRTYLTLLLLITGLVVFPASAQMMGGSSGSMQGGPGGMGLMDRPLGPMMGGPVAHRMGGRPHEAPLISLALAHSQELSLSPDQQQKLRDLQTGFAKEAVRKQADIRIAEIDLNAQLEQERWDLAKIEPLVKQIAAFKGDLRLARIKTLAAGRALLTPDQLTKLKQVGHRMGLPPGSGPVGWMQQDMGPNHGMQPGMGMQGGPGGPGPRPQP